MSRLSLCRVSASVIIAASVCFAQAGASAHPSDVQQIREAWYDIQFAGRKIGFIKAVDERTKVNGRPAFHLHRWSILSVKRRKHTVNIRSTVDAWFAPDGQPMRFIHERQEGAEKRSVEGYRDGKAMVIRQSIGKDLTEKRIPITDDLRLASSLDILIGERLEVGQKLKGQALDEQQGDVLPYEIEVKSVDAKRVFTVHMRTGPINAVLEVEGDGTIVDVLLPEMGVHQRKVSKSQAVQPSEAIDLFSAALFRMPRPLPDRNDIEALVIALSSKQGRKLKVVADARQKAKRTGGKTQLTITVQTAPETSVRRPVTAKKWKPFLQATQYEPLSDEKLQATARRLTDGRPTVWEAARAINAFVYRHIRNKSLARAYASATEALGSGEGDCTEHAVLFSALAKIAGIPTRLVTGLVYVGGADNIFGYHEWVEIWTGQQWLAMDPTFGQDIADATHIKLHAGQSNPEGLREAGAIAAGAIGDLEIELVAFVDTKGQKQPL